MAELVVTHGSQPIGSAPSGAFDSINAISGTMTVTQADTYYSDAGARHMLISNPGAVAAIIKWLIASAPDVEIVSYHKVSTMPTADISLLQVDDGGGSSTQMYVRGVTNQGRVATLTKGTTREVGTPTITAGQWLRFGLRLIAGTSATTGQLRAAWALGDNDLAADSGLITGINTADATASFAALRAGKYGTAAYSGDISQGRLIIRTGADISGTFKPYTPAATATATPLCVLSYGGWTNVGGAVSAVVALTDASDTTVMRSPDAAAADQPTLLRLSTLSAGTAIAGPFRMKLAPSSAATPAQIDILEGSTVRATRLVSVTSETATDFTVTLSSGEVASITDRSNLRALVTAKAA